MKKNSFSYWFAHWCAYQAVAISHGCWRFRFLFHDWYKPWLGLIWPYERVREFHRKHSNHHPEYLGTKRGPKKLDYLGMIVDWEASKVTKPKVKPEDSNGAFWVTMNVWPNLSHELRPLLRKYGFKMKSLPNDDSSYIQIHRQKYEPIILNSCIKIPFDLRLGELDRWKVSQRKLLLSKVEELIEEEVLFESPERYQKEFIQRLIILQKK